MKRGVAIVLIAGATVLAGCSKQSEPAFVVDDSQALHAAMLENYWAEHTEAASVRSNAMYAYHFRNDSAQLNGLGEYEVDVLARHAEGGPLNVYLARGSATDQLYAERTNALIDALVDAGANPGTIRVNDELSGGDGMHSDRVRFNAEREAEQLQPRQGYDQSSTGAGPSME